MSGISLNRQKLASMKSSLQTEFTRQIEKSKTEAMHEAINTAAWAAEALAIFTFPSRPGIIYALKAMRQDVSAVYALPGAVFDRLKSNPSQANAFWAAMKNGDIARARSIVRASGTSIASIQIGDALDPSLHDRARDSKTGRVILENPLQMVTKQELDAYMKTAIRRLGKTASGWVAAFHDLGGAGDTGSWWKGTTIHGSDGGHARISQTKQSVTITLINTRPLARKHLSPGQVDRIMKDARERLLQGLKSKIAA